MFIVQRRTVFHQECNSWLLYSTLGIFVRELHILMSQVFAATWMIPRQETESSKVWSRGRWQFRERWPSVKLWGWELENSSELVWNYFPFMCHDLFETVLHILAFSLWLYLVWPLYKKRLSLIGHQCLVGKYTKRPSRTKPPDRLLSSYFVNFNLSIASMCKDMIVHCTAQKVTEFTSICLSKDTVLVIWKMLQQIIILRWAGGDGISGHCHNKVLPDPSRGDIVYTQHPDSTGKRLGVCTYLTFLALCVFELGGW